MTRGARATANTFCPEYPKNRKTPARPLPAGADLMLPELKLSDPRWYLPTEPVDSTASISLEHLVRQL